MKNKKLGYKPFLKKLMYLATSENSKYKEEARKAWDEVEQLSSDYDILTELDYIVHKYGFRGSSYNCVEPFWDAVNGMKKSIRKELNEMKKNWKSIKINKEMLT
jgi:uncharacterized protein YutD